MSPTSSLSNSDPSGTYSVADFTPLLCSMTSGLLLFLAFPPLGWWPLAWIAPVGWCWLIATPRFGGRHPLIQIYTGGVLHWMLLIHWIRLPHWSAYFGWLTLSLFLAIYVVGFVKLGRLFVQKHRWPLVVAAAVSWTAMELLRGHVLTGFSMALLSHSQVDQLRFIQAADVGGAYLISFVVMMFSASLVQVGTSRATGYRRWWPFSISILAIAAACLYGHVRLAQLSAAPPADNSIQVALIQGSIDTTFSPTDSPSATLDRYRRITTEALAAAPSVRLIVWPESMHTYPWFVHKSPGQRPDDFPGDDAAFEDHMATAELTSQLQAAWFGSRFGTSAFFGCPTIETGPFPLRRFNSGLWTDPAGKVVGRYDKMHPVMFGEYIPLGRWIPALYRLTPMANGIESGKQPLSIEVDGVRLSPCICFENTVPHLIRRQVNRLTDAGQSPDALITITNDGWFWGSSQLDLHLACGVFRAIETRRPMLIAANTGISAHIDSTGNNRSSAQRRTDDVLLASVGHHRSPQSAYLRLGDAFGWLCVASGAYVVSVSVVARFRA